MHCSLKIVPKTSFATKPPLYEIVLVHLTSNVQDTVPLKCNITLMHHTHQVVSNCINPHCLTASFSGMEALYTHKLVYLTIKNSQVECAFGSCTGKPCTSCFLVFYCLYSITMTIPLISCKAHML